MGQKRKATLRAKREAKRVEAQRQLAGLRATGYLIMQAPR